MTGNTEAGRFYLGDNSEPIGAGKRKAQRPFPLFFPDAKKDLERWRLGVPSPTIDSIPCARQKVKLSIWSAGSESAREGSMERRRKNRVCRDHLFRYDSRSLKWDVTGVSRPFVSTERGRGAAQSLVSSRVLRPNRWILDCCVYKIFGSPLSRVSIRPFVDCSCTKGVGKKVSSPFFSLVSNIPSKKNPRRRWNRS